MKKNAPRITRNSGSTSANNSRSSSLVKHTTQCSKYSINQSSTPFLRACGCAHRFVPSNINSTFATRYLTNTNITYEVIKITSLEYCVKKPLVLIM